MLVVSAAEHIPPLAVIVDDLTNVWHTNDQGHVLKVLPYNPYRDHALRQAGVDVAHADASDNELARVQEAIMYIRGQFYKVRLGHMHGDVMHGATIQLYRAV